MAFGFHALLSIVLFFYLSAELSFVSLGDDVVESEDPDKAKIVFSPPPLPKDAYKVLYFNSSEDLNSIFTVSQARKDGVDDSLAKYDGIWSVEVPHASAIVNDYALVLKSVAKHHAISAMLDKPLNFDSDEVVLQYEVRFPEEVVCAGGYLKLVSSYPNIDLKMLNDKTPYSIMFGPDKCGIDSKFHFIIRYENPRTGTFEEKHAKKVAVDLDKYFSDGKTHLYTLVLRDGGTYERFIDQEKVQSGSLLEDFEPPINPPAEIDDPNDKKPDDWDDREKIVDKTATKPDDWDEDAPEFIKDDTATKPSGWLDDEPDTIPDPEAKPPSDWDREMDGEWEAPTIKNPKCVDAPGCGEWTPPLIRNPKYKGKWSPPLIPNPAYKGIWTPKKIPNPNYFEHKNPYRNLPSAAALGWELWSMTSEITFDNILITTSKREADDFAAHTWSIKHKAEKMNDRRASSVIDAIRETYEEKPWLVFVIGCICTLPILLCCIYFRRSSRHSDALHKKTDEYTPADKLSKQDDAKDNGDIDVCEESGEEDIVQVTKGSGDESDGRRTQSGDSGEETNVPNERPSGKEATRKRRSRRE